MIHTIGVKKQGNIYYSTLGTDPSSHRSGSGGKGFCANTGKENMVFEQTYTKQCAAFLRVDYQTRALICRININDNSIDQERRFRYVR